jgi:hypothetical protein
MIGFHFKRLVGIVSLLLLVSCGMTPEPGSRRSSSRVLTADEIQMVEGVDGYELVQRLRPQWFRMRGPGSLNRPSPIRVYVNAVPVGGVAQLRQLDTSQIRGMEFLSSSEATSRFGTDHASGAILVTTG